MGLLPWLLGALLACRAETLGVELPRGGPQAISQEDLQRDVFQLVSLERSPTGDPVPRDPEAAADGLELRLRQMHTLPAWDDRYRRRSQSGDWHLCGLREGRSPQVILVAALDGGRGATLGASPVAVLLSLAKAGDVPGRPELSHLFCRVAPGQTLEDFLRDGAPVPPDRLARVLLLGPFGGEQVQETPFLGGVLLTTGPDPVHGTDADGMERVDWRLVEQQVRDTWYRHLASGAPGSEPPPPGP